MPATFSKLLTSVCFLGFFTGYAAADEWSILEKGPNHRRWARQDPLPGGLAREQNAPAASPEIVEIATGMNYWNGQEWVPSVASFEVADNAFVANRLQYRVSLNDNLNRVGAVTVVTHDGVTIHSTPVAIGLFDAASGRSAVIAAITDSFGVLVGNKQVVYQNAFAGLNGEGFCADVVYTIDRASFEQDVVITSRLDPDDYGFPKDTTRIQIYTEFYDAPRPHKIRRPIQVEERENVRKRMASPDLIDEVLGFGEFVLATGRAFNSGAAPGASAAPVAKEFVTKAGRTFLIESVEYVGIQKELESLAQLEPKRASLQKTSARNLPEVKYAVIPSAAPRKNSQADAGLRQKTTRVASAALPPQTGVVIDYIATVGGTLNGPLPPFKGDTTYFVSGAVICNGAATIEGGAVFKFKHQTTAPAGYASIKFNSTLTCKTSSYRPAIFTAVDDDSVGETMLGYAGSGYQQPVRTDGYANPAIWLYNLTAQNLSHFRFSYCQEAVRVEGGSGHTLSHAQLVKCIRGIVITGSGSGSGSGSSTTITVNNALFSNVASPITVNKMNTVCSYYHCTVDSSPPVAALVTTTVSGGSASFYNCVFANITAAVSGTISLAGAYNGFYSCPQFGTQPVGSPGLPFQSKGAGNYYLAANSVFRNAGTTAGINSSMLADLRKRTTDPPVDPPVQGPSYTWWNPVAARDVDLLDLGYHYASLDYLCSEYTMGGAPHVLTNGVAVGFFGARGIIHTGGGGVFSEGRPDALNRLVWYPSVQEQPVLLNSVRTGPSGLFDITASISDKVISFGFTEIAMLGLRQKLFTEAHPHNLPMVFLTDCTLGGVDFTVSLVLFENAVIPANATLRNNVLERCTVSLFGGCLIYYYATGLYHLYQNPMYVTLYNNLFWQSSVSLEHRDDQSIEHPTWAIKDNLFDNTTIAFTGNGNYLTLVQRSNNGFYNSPGSSVLGGSANKDLTALTYVPGAWYIASSSPTIVDQGSRTAGSAQLFHYTILSGSQQREENSQVDIGFHYVAVGADGLPIDTDLDGIPDYVEDRNGDGVKQSWETSYLERDTDGDGLTDLEERTITLTDPVTADTGNTGVPDGYKDPDGDGWSHLEEIRNATNPFVFNTPRTPPAPTVIRNPNGTVTLEWDPSLGISTTYTVQRDLGDGSGFMTIATITAGQPLTYNDTTVPAGVSPTYQVITTYANNSTATSTTLNVSGSVPQVIVSLARGPGGVLQLVSSWVPQSMVTLRLYRDVGTANYRDADNNDHSYVPIGGGSMDIPAGQLRNQVYTIPQSFAPPYGLYQFRYQWIDDQGQAGAVVVAGVKKAIPFLDGTAALKDNLRFNLRTQRGGEPFRFICLQNGQEIICHTDYVQAGLYYAPVLEELNPFKENYFLRNWAYNAADFSWYDIGGGEEAFYFDTGVPGNGVYNGDLLKYYVPAYEYVTTQNPTLLNSQISPAASERIYLQYSVPAFFGDPGFEEYWLDNAGLTLTSDGVGTQLATQFRNIFGLAYTSARAVRTDNATIQDIAPGPANAVPNFSAGTGREYFQTLEAPVLVNSGYYFGQITDWLPTDELFNINMTTPLMIGVSGRAMQMFGWAKQTIQSPSSGSPIANRFAYLGQYFDKAYKVDPATGQRTSQETGVLSEYGEFFPTEPGRVILTTKPDPDQGNQQGECLVNIIKLEVDANHDGTIDRTFSGPDNTSPGRPFRFWLNNDNDGVGGGTEIDAPKAPDSGNPPISSSRDLEDFARLWVSGVPALAVGQGYTVTLNWRNGIGPTIRLFRASEVDGGNAYLTSSPEGGLQMAQSVFTLIGPQTVYQFPANFFTQLGRKHFIFEGVLPGSGELVLSIRQNGHLLAETSLFMQLTDVKDMYEAARITNVQGGQPPSSLVSQYQLLRNSRADSSVAKQMIVFVHGINNSEFSWQSSSDTLFKRLYWSGYQGRFATVRWPCAYLPDDNGFAPVEYLKAFNFNLGEFYAWKSAAGLRNYMTYLRNARRLPGYKLALYAHSQGTVVSSEAIVQGAPFDTLILSQGAIPAHCYDPGLTFAQKFLTKEATSPTPLPAVIGGYHAYFADIGGTVVNLFNDIDFALATGTTAGFDTNWEANHLSYRPEFFTGIVLTQYTYDPTQQKSFRNLTGEDVHESHEVTDFHEAKAMVARTRTKAVGALAGVQGAVDRSVDLRVSFTFGNTRDEHSGQFVRPIHTARPYYLRLLDEINMP